MNYRVNNQRHQPRSESMSGRYRLVQSKNQDDSNEIYGIYWQKGHLVISIPYTWIAKLFYAWCSLNFVLAIWTTFFAHITIVHSALWVMSVALTLVSLYGLARLNAWYDAKYNPIAITKLPFMLFIILFAYGFAITENRHWIQQNAKKLLEHDLWLEGLQFAVDGLTDTVEAMDDKFTKLTKELDERYTKTLEQKAEVQRMEKLASQMWEGFGLITITRQHFGLGCFINGTMIQLDEDGTMKPIEELNEYDVVYNPDLNKTFSIKVMTMGPEQDGYIYQFITNDSLSVSVTKTHPMKICNPGNMVCENIAAAEVQEGSITETVNGYKAIIEINKSRADGVMVYNLWLDVNEDRSDIERTIIANGIHTFDLKVQSMNE